MATRMDFQGGSDFEALSKLEWLETNGLGGWASSTLSGAHSRRYHGLLVAAVDPPVGRAVLVSKLEETLHFEDSSFRLSANRYPGAVHPQGFKYLSTFERDIFPVFEFEVGGSRLRKTVAAVEGENTTLVLYELLDVGPDSGPMTLSLRPLLTWRDHHALGTAATAPQASFDGDVLRCRMHPEAPEVFLRVPGARFRPEADWYHRFQFEIERRRGFDYEEDLWTPGEIACPMVPGEVLGLVISTEPPARRTATSVLEKERSRREGLLDRLPAQDEVTRVLGLAADQFVVRRGKDLKTIIAGYPWFGDWGRDTMISLPGLCLVTGRHDDAKRILRAFAASISEGMLPNRFVDSGETPEYNTVDATLWYFIAIAEYLRVTQDDGFVRDELLPVLRDILTWHDRGTRYGIQVAEDGLLTAGEPGVQLTWMDARVGNWVVTPREGKAVEVNALWYNALKILGDLEERFGDLSQSRALKERANHVRGRFARTFWNDEAGCLYDVVDGASIDPATRPNQLFALSLPWPLVGKKRALQILAVVEERLLTPVGLRSLSADHSEYRPHYGGGPVARDGAYHQGTVWGWLLGPYLTAVVRFRGSKGREQARAVFARAVEHLHEAGVGTYSEIFDAEAPYSPRGAFAQAWSVAELLRTRLEVL
jgi:predicted glycogen debranching enzyme